MDHSSFTNFSNPYSHLTSGQTTTNDGQQHRAMANFSLSSAEAFARQEAANLAGFHQGATAHLLLHSSGSHANPTEAFMSSASTGLLKATYGPGGLLPYSSVAGTQANIPHSSLFGSFQPRETEVNELREGFSRGLHPLSMLASQNQAMSATRTDLFPSRLHQQTASSQESWHMPSAISSSSMFGVLPHESVGSKTSEKTRKSPIAKSLSSVINSHSSSISAKNHSFLYGTSPSAGTTAKTTLSNELLSSPTYLPHPQYNTFLNLNDKQDLYDQKMSAIDYTSSGANRQKNDQKHMDSFIQQKSKSEIDVPQQSPLMCNPSPVAASHNSPHVSSTPVISPMEPTVYSPATNQKYHAENPCEQTESYIGKFPTGSIAHRPSSQLSGDIGIGSHASPQNPSIHSHSSPLGSSTASSPFISQSPRDPIPNKDYHPMSSDLSSSHFVTPHSMLSPMNCTPVVMPTEGELASASNYDLITRRSVPGNVGASNQAESSAMDSDFDDLAMHELAKIENDSRNCAANSVDNFSGVNNVQSVNPSNRSKESIVANRNDRPSKTNATDTTERIDECTAQRKLSEDNTILAPASFTDDVESADDTEVKFDDAFAKSDCAYGVQEEREESGNKLDCEKPVTSAKTEKKPLLSKHGRPSGKPAGYISSYMNFIQNTCHRKPSAIKSRKRGRPRKQRAIEDILNSDVASSNINGVGNAARRNPSRTVTPGNFAFSDSDDEVETGQNVLSDKVQIALNSLNDESLNQKTNADPNVTDAGSKTALKRKIYEKTVDTDDSNPVDIYDFDFECAEPVLPVRLNSYKSKSPRQTSPGRYQLPPSVDTNSATVENTTKKSESKCAPKKEKQQPVVVDKKKDEPVIVVAEKVIVKVKEPKLTIQTASKKKIKRPLKFIHKTHKSSDEDDIEGSDDEWIPLSKNAGLPDESDKSSSETENVEQEQKHQKRNKLDQPIKKKPRMHRREITSENVNDDRRLCPLKTGDFVINVKDVCKEKPILWRIHGKGLMQKYESFDKDDKILFQSIPSYTSWNANNSSNYIPVNVRFESTSRGNCTVEYLGPVRSDPKFMNLKTRNQEISQFQAQKENFEVYLQTLISQALDPNFISEIVKENDEYFLSHMIEIDDMAIRRKDRLIKGYKWKEAFLNCVQYYPCVNVITTKSIDKGPCQACSSSVCAKLVQFYGQPYDYTTLRRTILFADSYLSGNKEFCTCENCSELVNLYNRLHHQKYNFYIACHTKVNNVRVTSKDMRLESHVILEKCLQDNDWINQMFEEITSLWIECDRMS